jgi:hypothetical protein
LQSFWLLNEGRGFEHHFPHLYSQVGSGAIVVVDVHKETVVVALVVVVEVIGGVVVVTAAVEVVEVAGTVVELEYVEEETTGGVSLQGSRDLRSLAT